MNAHAVVFAGPNEVEVQSFALREPGPGELLVAAAYSCVSPGTELRTLRGEEAAAGPFPLIPGYALTGCVVRGGDGTTLPAGTPVYCMGTSHSGPFGSFSSGHVSLGIVPESQAIPLPEGLSLRDAVVAVLGAIALHGRNLVPAVAGKRVLVVGLGVIGQFSARLFALAGVAVTACDLSPERVALARAAGLQAVCPAGDEPLVKGGAEVVVDSTGVPAVLNWALRQAHVPGWDPAGPYAEAVWCVVQGSYAAEVPIHYPTAFMHELRLVVPRSTCYSDIAETMRLIRDGHLACEDLISLEAGPEEAPAIYARLAGKEAELMTAVFRWEAAEA